MIDKEISQVNWLYFNKHKLITLNTRGEASVLCSQSGVSFCLSPQLTKNYRVQWPIWEGSQIRKIAPHLHANASSASITLSPVSQPVTGGI